MSEDGSESPPRPVTSFRLVAVLVLGLVAAVVSRVAAPTTRIEIVSDGGRLEVTANGSRLAAGAAPSNVSRLVISATDSIDPPGGGRLVVERPDGTVREWRLPVRFRFEGAGVPPVGDWWVDAAAPTDVAWSADVDLDGPFALETTITGRPLQAVSFRFDGDRPLSVDVRRGLINNDLAVRTPGGGTLATTSLDPDPVRDLAAVLSTLLSGVVAAAGLIAIAALLARLAPHAAPHGPAPTRWTVPWPVVTATLAAGGVVVSTWIASDVLARLPHLPDEVVHHIQADWLLDGRVTQAVVGWQDGLDVPHTYVIDGRWLAQYPFVWPAVLAPAVVIDLAWIVAPLLGGVAIWLVWGLGRELYGNRVGVAAAALTAVSPLMRLLAASTLSHTAEICLLVGAAWACTRGLRTGGRPLLLVAGLMAGLAVGVRPLPTVVMVAAFVLVVGSTILERNTSHLPSRLLAWPALGLAVGALPTLATNLAVTGHALQFGYGFAGRPMYGPSNLGFGAQNLDAILAHLPPQLFGWGWGWMDPWLVSALPLALPFVVVLLRRDRPTDRALFVVVGLLLLSLLGTHGHGLHGFGPRYLAEAVPFVALLAARGAFELATVSTGRPAGRVTAVALLSALVVGGLSIISALQLPSRMSHYRGYNHVGRELVDALDAAAVDRGVVVFTRDDWRDWARATPLLDPGPDAELLFVRSTGIGDPLCRAAADRPWWRWNGVRLSPWPDPPCGGPR